MTVENTTAVSEEVAAPAGPSISLPDIAFALRIIDTAAERGAFRGNELTPVGQVRDRIAAFLEAVTPKEEVEEAVAETVDAPKKKASKRK